MLFHDCSILSSSSSDTSETVSQYQSFDFPNLSSPAGLSTAHLNCRNLFYIVDEVFYLFISNCVDVFAVTETWLDSSIDDCEIFPYSSSISSISIVQNDQNCHGGGVAFLLLSRVKFAVRPDLCEGHIQSIWIELFPKTKRSMLLCCVYFPHPKIAF